jgi:hypothetical protein
MGNKEGRTKTGMLLLTRYGLTSESSGIAAEGGVDNIERLIPEDDNVRILGLDIVNGFSMASPCVDEMTWVELIPCYCREIAWIELHWRLRSIRPGPPYGSKSLGYSTYRPMYRRGACDQNGKVPAVSSQLESQGWADKGSSAC